jgi:hypothetical protein
MTTLSDSNKFYGNWKVFSPDGHLMFRCNEKRANWYLKRNIADLIGESIISLKFQPKGLGNHGKSFGLEPMENKCVNCGGLSNLTKHHIVPFAYRRHFPIELKSRNFHDVLLLCLYCHQNYEKKAYEFKKELGERYKFPFNSSGVGKSDLKRIKHFSKVLIQREDNLPTERKIHIYNFLEEKFGENFFNYLEKLTNLDISENKKTHFQHVVEKIEDFQEFIEMWRKHFIENNEVKYLPKSWNIKNELRKS